MLKKKSNDHFPCQQGTFKGALWNFAAVVEARCLLIEVISNSKLMLANVNCV